MRREAEHTGEKTREGAISVLLLDFFFLQSVKQAASFQGNELLQRSMIRLKEVGRRSKGNRHIALFSLVALLLFVPGDCGRLLAERMSDM